MSHQPFESWLLSEPDLNIKQQETLEKHLYECEQCISLSNAVMQMEESFSSSPSPSPAPGFTQRFHTRLFMHRQQRQQVKMWTFTMGLFVAAGLLFTLLILCNVNNLNWAYEVSRIIASVSLAAARINQLINAINMLTHFFPIFIPILVIFGTGTLLAISVLVLTWFISVINLYKPIYEGVRVK